MKNATFASIDSQKSIFYQYAFALACLLDLREGDSIFIETLGDVTIKDKVQFEVKHHGKGNVVLSERTEDFWKTIRNWKQDWRIFKDYNELILATTSNISTKSFLVGWNDLNADQKLRALKGVNLSKNKSIEKLRDSVFDGVLSDQDLKKMLAKVKLSPNRRKQMALLKSLESHKIFAALPKSNRKYLIKDLIGTLFIQTLTSKKNTEIQYADLIGVLQKKWENYSAGKIPIAELVSFVTEPDGNAFVNERFVKELKKIEVDGDLLTLAITHYHKAMITVIEICDGDSMMVDDINRYENSLEEDLKFEKSGFKADVNIADVALVKATSRKMYTRVMLWKADPFGRISPNDPSFQRGVIHNIVNDDKFKWLLSD